MAKIEKKEVREAATILEKYKTGKQNLDQRIKDNEEWFRQQHWHQFRKRRQTGWLHTAIVNKHADFLDNMPEANVLPREPEDEKTAQALTNILPVVLERGGWPLAYDKASYDKVKFGCGIYSVLWNPKMDNGIGNVQIRRAEGLNLYWEPGVEDIQQSQNLFLLELIEHEKLKAMYPKVEGLDRLGGPSITMKQYTRQENINDSEKSVVVNWYYKRYKDDKAILHYCRFVEDIVLFASENDELYKNGWYEDGKYPYVFDPFFYEPESPHGFGLIDTGRDTQEDIDELNDAMMRNAKIAARRRWFVRENAKINMDAFADLDEDFVPFGGTLDEATLREIPSELLGGIYMNVLQSKEEEMKELTFNRDVNSGGTGGGSQTAAGIAALQESGSKSSRAAIQGTYRAFKEIVAMVIERMRQFYTTERYFRILGENKQPEYVTFSNKEFGRPINGINMEFGEAEPIFDLDIKVSKQNAWSRQAQNADAINFYNMGFFAPQMAQQSLACLEVLDIDNKEKLIQVIQSNNGQQQFLEQYMPLLLRAAQAADPQLAMMAAQAAQAAGINAGVPTQNAQGEMVQTDAIGGMQRSNNYMDKQRQLAAARTAPQV